LSSENNSLFCSNRLVFFNKKTLEEDDVAASSIKQTTGCILQRQATRSNKEKVGGSCLSTSLSTASSQAKELSLLRSDMSCCFFPVLLDLLACFVFLFFKKDYRFYLSAFGHMYLDGRYFFSVNKISRFTITCGHIPMVDESS
jgi:hypothetical protein